jgi:hypothetical protein
MPVLTCTYCGAEITAQAVEAEDGHCPECGAVITLVRSKFGDDEDDELGENSNSFEEEDETQDEFLDEKEDN